MCNFFRQSMSTVSHQSKSDAEPRNLLDFSDEILIKILGYCSQADLHRRIALVSLEMLKIKTLF
jgi:hypothetical protein